MPGCARSLQAAAIAGVVVVLASASAMAETLNVRLDKAEILRLDVPASIVIVGNPEIADVTVENPNMLFVTGLAAGETNLVILDSNGDAIMDYDLVVVSEIDRQVTVHRNIEQLSTFSCKPRCIEVANPSDIERLRQFSESADEEEADGDPVPAPPADEEASADASEADEPS